MDGSVQSPESNSVAHPTESVFQSTDLYGALELQILAPIFGTELIQNQPLTEYFVVNERVFDTWERKRDIFCKDVLSFVHSIRRKGMHQQYTWELKTSAIEPSQKERYAQNAKTAYGILEQAITEQSNRLRNDDAYATQMMNRFGAAYEGLFMARLSEDLLKHMLERVSYIGGRLQGSLFPGVHSGIITGFRVYNDEKYVLGCPPGALVQIEGSQDVPVTLVNYPSHSSSYPLLKGDRVLFTVNKRDFAYHYEGLLIGMQ